MGKSVSRDIEVQIEAFGAWMEENRGLTRGTLRAYCKTMQAILRAGGSPYDHLRKDLTPSYRGMVVATLRHWAYYTNDQMLVDLLLEEKTKRLVRQPRSRPKVTRAAMSGEELDAFLEVLKAREEPAWSRPCLGLMAKLGLRSNDMLRLSKEDVESAEGSDRLRVIGKGEKERWLPTSPVEDELECLLDIDEDWDYVWDIVAPSSAPDNRPENAYGRIWREVRDVAKLAGIEDMSTHRLRKGVARRMYERSGGSIADVSRLLGHSDPKTTMVYLDLAMDDFIALSGEILGRDE